MIVMTEPVDNNILKQFVFVAFLVNVRRLSGIVKTPVYGAY